MLEPPEPHVKRAITLAAVGTAARVSRSFVADAWRRWNLPDALQQLATLVASELVSNAINATGTLEDRPPRHEPASLIRLRLVLLNSSLFVEVWDRDVSPPVMKDEPTDMAEGGRGLQIVGALTKRWSYYLSDAGGKVVWAELEVPVPPPELPRRPPRLTPPVEPKPVPYSMTVVRRVRDGLREL